MQQLTGSDNGFLYAEQGNNYNHVAGLALYDPSTAPGGKTSAGHVRFCARLEIDVHHLTILLHRAAKLSENKPCMSARPIQSSPIVS